MRHKPWLVSVFLCLGFAWPGRLPRLQYELTHGDTERRVEVARMLASYAAPDVREALLGALDDNAVSVRLEAVRSLGEVRVREAVPVLLEWVGDKDPTTRVTVLQALGEIGDARAQAALARALGDAMPDVRRAACDALHALGGDEVVTPLLGALEDRDASVRLTAATALIGTTDARAVAALSLRCRDDVAEVRGAALTALGQSRDPRALALLLQGLHDSASDVRMAATMALGALGDAKAIDELHASLTSEPALAKAAISALGRIDGAHAQALVIAALAQPEIAATARAALVLRAQRGAADGSLVQDLASALTAHPAPETANAIADALRELAQLGSIAPATGALIAALHDATTNRESLAIALAQTHSEDALLPLLEALDSLDDASLPGVLTALANGGELDGRAADPLVARLAKSHGPARVALVTALGRTRAPRVVSVLLPLTAADDRALRLAAIEALGAIGGDQASPALRALLDDRDADVRDGAGHALGQSASEADVSSLIDTLRSPATSDRQARLIALSGALPRLEQAHALSAETRALAIRTLEASIVSEDDTLADRALETLRAFAPPESVNAIAHLWRTPSGYRRATAALALSAFDGTTTRDDTRKLLRFMLRQASPKLTLAVVAALAEVGDHRDVDALLALTKRKHWPVPTAATFALARLAQRGEVKKRALERDLCTLAHTHEPYLRANVATALATIGAGACNDELHPLRWLEQKHAPAVRVAAAAWAKAARDSGALPAKDVDAALRACASDADESVSRACAPGVAGSTAPAGAAALYAYGSDGVSTLVHRLVALRLPSGAVFVGYTDANAHLMVRSVGTGELLLEDPAQAPRDP